MFLGHIVHHAVVDPRDGKTLLAAARTGHLGPTVFRSTDGGRTWKEARAAAARSPKAAAASSTTRSGSRRGTRREPGVWYAGTSPQGLFRSADGGATWEGVDGLQRASAAQGVVRRRPGRHARRPEAAFDPRRSARSEAPLHRHVERRRVRVDRRRAPTGSRSTRACAPISCRIPNPEFGHDPHCVRFAAGNPDRLYQQNHCGIYRLDRPADALDGHRRRRCRSRSATIGFPMVAASARSGHAVGVSRWTAPTCGRASSPGGKPAVYRSRDGGQTWKRQDEGLPKAQAWWTVKRQAMTADRAIRRASTSARRRARCGAAATRAARGRCLARHLPHIYAVEAADDAGVGQRRARRSIGAMQCASPEAAAIVRVRIPTPLQSYTGSAEVHVAVPVLAPELPPTLGGVLAALDGAYPGHSLSDDRRAGQRPAAHQAVRRLGR